MISLILLSCFFIQQDDASQDNAKVIALLNKQSIGEQSSCDTLSPEFGKGCGYQISRPGQRFLMANFAANQVTNSKWKYDSPSAQANFRSSLIKAIKVPYREYQTSVMHGGPSKDGTRLVEAIRFDKYINGVLDGFDSLNVGFNYATGRITTIDLDMSGVPIEESQLLTDATVRDYFNQSGKDYQTVVDRFIWYPLTKKLRTVSNSNGTVPLYKMRVVSVKRNNETQSAYFRMDGSVYNPLG